MIGALRGKLLQKLPAELLVDVHGVGYIVTASKRSLSRSGGIGSEIELIIYTDVKENSISLFGFADQLEREVFLLLKKVKGIGPKYAMAIVSALGPEGVLSAVGRGEIARLKEVPGVGKKTAERVLIELREYVGDLARESADETILAVERLPISTEEDAATALPGSAPQSDAVLALEKLGFARDRARKAVQAAARENLNVNDPGELLRLSFAHLS